MHVVLENERQSPSSYKRISIGVGDRTAARVSPKSTAAST